MPADRGFTPGENPWDEPRSLNPPGTGMGGAVEDDRRASERRIAERRIAQQREGVDRRVEQQPVAEDRRVAERRAVEDRRGLRASLERAPECLWPRAGRRRRSTPAKTTPSSSIASSTISRPAAGDKAEFTVDLRGAAIRTSGRRTTAACSRSSISRRWRRSTATSLSPRSAGVHDC